MHSFDEGAHKLQPVSKFEQFMAVFNQSVGKWDNHNDRRSHTGFSDLQMSVRSMKTVLVSQLLETDPVLLTKPMGYLVPRWLACFWKWFCIQLSLGAGLYSSHIRLKWTQTPWRNGNDTFWQVCNSDAILQSLQFRFKVLPNVEAENGFYLGETPYGFYFDFSNLNRIYHSFLLIPWFFGLPLLYNFSQ